MALGSQIIGGDIAHNKPFAPLKYELQFGSICGSAKILLHLLQHLNICYHSIYHVVMLYHKFIYLLHRLNTHYQLIYYTINLFIFCTNKI